MLTDKVIFLLLATSDMNTVITDILAKMKVCLFVCMNKSYADKLLEFSVPRQKTTVLAKPLNDYAS